MSIDPGKIEAYQGRNGEVAKIDPQFFAWILRNMSVIKEYFDTTQTGFDSNAAAFSAESFARIAGDSDVQTNVNSEAVARQNGDTALAAQVTDEITARIDGDSAEATARLALEATLNSSIADVAAAVTVEETARVTALEALASQVTTLSARMISDRNKGQALNSDPVPSNIADWLPASDVTIEQIADGVAGNSVLRGAAGEWEYNSVNPAHVDLHKDYEVSIWYRAANSADGTISAAVALYDADGNPIGTDLPDLWLEFLVDAPNVSDWTQATARFGATQVRTFPDAARTMAPAVAMNVGGTMGYFEIQRFQIAEITTLLAEITEERTARVTADEAFATDIATLFAAVVSGSGNHIFVQGTAPTDPPTTLLPNDLWYDTSDSFHPYYWDGAAWQDNQDGDIAAAFAAVVTEATARATADTAEATTRAANDATIVTALGVTNANVTSEATTRATADTAEATARAAADATLTTALGVTNANVTSEATARAAADTAEATARLAVNARVNDVDAGTLFRMHVGATTSGSDATLEIQVWSSSAGTWSSAGIFLEAKTGGGSEIRLDASTIKLNGILFVNGAILTANIASGAVTGGLDGSGTGATLLASGAPYTLVSGSFTASGNKVLVTLDALDNANLFYDAAQIDFVVDSVAVRSWTISPDGAHLTPTIGNDAFNSGGAPLFWYSLSAGSHTIALVGTNAGGNADLILDDYFIDIKDWHR